MKTWDIDWYICRADAGDVEYARGKREPDLNLQVGGELWRTAQRIGPLAIDHNHWSGWHIDCTEKQARVAAAAPALLAALREIVTTHGNLSEDFTPIDSAASFLTGFEDIKEEDL